MGYLSHPANYDKFPAVRLKGITGASKGWENIAEQIAKSLPTHRDAVIAIDCYPGVDVAGVQSALGAFSSFAQATWFYADTGYIHGNELDARLADTLSEDRVFGIMSCANLADYLLLESAKALKQNIASTRGLSIIIGTGASLITECDLLIYADYPRWQRQLDWRAGGSNWLAVNPEEDILKKYKRGFFWEWRIADRHKRDLFPHFDYYLDTLSDPAVMIDNAAFQSVLDACLKTPFRLNPFFDPGVWGGKLDGGSLRAAGKRKELRMVF